MRKEAPKPKFNRFKVLETKYFYENNLHGALENACGPQIWRRKCCRRQEKGRSRLQYIGPKSWIEGASKRRWKDQTAPGFGHMAGRPSFLAGQLSAFWITGRPAICFMENRLATSPFPYNRPAMVLTGSPSSLQILRKIGVPGTWKSSRKVHFRSQNCSVRTSASKSDMCLIIIHQNQSVSFLNEL